ncbi:membrane protein [Spirochaetia bacterium]|nr:membrane protein [Spirochaetia bacterium]
MTELNKDRWKGQGAVFCCAILWSTSGLFIKLVSWHPVVIAGSRSLVAAVFMLVVRLFFTPKDAPKSKPGPLWAGAFAYAFTMLCFVIANKLTASANVILLQYSAPVWAAILGWLLIKEKPHWEHWAALVCVIGGMLLFFKDGLASGNSLGNAIAVLSGIFFGAHSVILRMQKDGSPVDSMLLAHVINFTIAIPFMILYPPTLTVPSVLPIVFMGTIQVGFASILFSYGIKRVTAVSAMLTAMIEPVLNPVWVLVVTGERPSVSALIGGVIIVSAVVAASLIGKRRELQEV